jgi:hypothetical protein
MNSYIVWVVTRRNVVRKRLKPRVTTQKTEELC